MKVRQDSLQRAKQAVETLRQNRSQLIEEILSRVIIESLKKYQQKVNVGVQDSVSDLMETFKLKVAEEVFDVSENWTLSSKREKLIFPRGCRFLYTMGRSTFVVIEQDPGVRTISLHRSLLSTQEQRTTSGNHVSFCLSMPYVVFVLCFRNTNNRHQFSNLFVGWRQSPLREVGDMLYYPYLPNQHVGLAVCTGKLGTLPDTNSISDLTESIIGHYWNSQFNSDLSDQWWKKSSVPTISTATKWQETSEEDPLNVLQIPLQEGKSLEEILENCSVNVENGEPEIMSLRHRLFDVIDGTSQNLFDKILKYFRKTRLERFYPKDITDLLTESLGETDQQLADLAKMIERELQRFEEDVNRSRKDISNYGWERKGVYWND